MLSAASLLRLSKFFFVEFSILVSLEKNPTNSRGAREVSPLMQSLQDDDATRFAPTQRPPQPSPGVCRLSLVCRQQCPTRFAAQGPPHLFLRPEDISSHALNGTFLANAPSFSPHAPKCRLPSLREQNVPFFHPCKKSGGKSLSSIFVGRCPTECEKARVSNGSVMQGTGGGREHRPTRGGRGREGAALGSRTPPDSSAVFSVHCPTLPKPFLGGQK
jgi:hypothetical protein